MSTLSDNNKRSGRNAEIVSRIDKRNNPHAQKMARLQEKFVELISEDDLRSIVTGLVNRAKGGDVMAAREILNRVLGKPLVGRDPDRLEVEAVGIEADRLEAMQRCRTSLPGDLQRAIAGF